SRAATFALIDFAHGRASWYVNSGIGAMAPWRWQFWQDRWRIGAMSFVNVTLCADAFEDKAPSTRRVKAQDFMNASARLLISTTEYWTRPAASAGFANTRTRRP